MNAHIVRFALSLFVLIAGGTLFVMAGHKPRSLQDPSLRLLRIPLLPDLLYTSIESCYLAYALLGIPSPSFLLPASEGIQLCLGLAYVLFTYRNLAVNGIDTTGYIPFSWIVVVTAGNLAAFAARYSVPANADALRQVNEIILGAILLYAGASAVSSRWKKGNLYPATKGGFWMALFCLAYVPFIGLAEIFSLPVGSFDSTRSVVLQAFPARELVILAIFASHLEPLYSRLRGTNLGHAPTLSARECEIADLLRMGLSNSAIASALFISLPTVKTHVRNVLRKSGLSSRAEIAKGIAN